MRIVEWTDENGWMHKSLVRSTDSDSVAIDGRGVLQDPPDINMLDWDSIKRDLHNKLLLTGVTSYIEVQKQQTGLRRAVTSAIVPRLLELFRDGG